MKDPQDLAMVAFRPGYAFGRVIREYSAAFAITRGEATKRLCIMGSLGFGPETFNILSQIAVATPGPDSFLTACANSRSSLLDAEREHRHSLRREEVLAVLTLAWQQTQNDLNAKREALKPLPA